MKGNFMESDICTMMRVASAGFEKMAEVLNALAEACEKILGCVKDLAEKLEEQALDRPERKMRPDYKDKCKIRWLDILDKTMQWRIRRFC